MAEIFVMPQASPTMEFGTILAWHKAEGDPLVPQDVIAEVETDKAAMEIEVFDPGFLLKILVPVGAEVPAGAPIAIIGTAADEDIAGLVAEAAAAAPQEAPGAASIAANATAAVAPLAANAGAASSQPAPRQVGFAPFAWQGTPVHSGFMEMPGFTVSDAAAAAGVPLASGRVRASPSARAAAREARVDLSTVRGTGPRGRITREDVENASHAGSPNASPGAASGPGAASVPDTLVRNSQMRKTIARRLKSAYLDAPVFFLTAELNCDNLVAFRSQLKEAGVKVSYNDLLVKACARALRDVPAVNASWGEQQITRHGRIDIGIAVALPDGLITPVLRDVDQTGLSAISAQTRDMAGRARERKLQPHEYTGSTFTISNLGMMAIDQFTAIINPPESCILAVGTLQQQPVVVDGALSLGWRMKVTMTCDHRVVDGALGAEFLLAVRRYIEHPALLAA